MINIDYQKCTGCGACIQICPVGCIQFTEDIDGFRYPSINSSACLNCKKCESVCPIKQELEHPKVTKAYACVSTNRRHLVKGTSGGAFGVIAEYVLNHDGIVYGCAFDKKLKAKHVRIASLKELHCLYGSKYVQSDINNSYAKVKDDLDKGRLVLFSGTPCQVAGLISFLGKPYDNLITIDIICHGVPSQAIFDKYLKWLSKKEKNTISHFSFRSKNNNGWSLSGYYALGNAENRIVKPLYYFDHYYYFYFLEGLIYRESCYSCKYANMHRQSDITLGDLWGAEGLGLNIDIDNGCSLVLLNSETALKLFDKLSLDSEEISISDAINNNEQLRNPMEKPQRREALMEQMRTMDGDLIQKEFEHSCRSHIIVSRLKYMVPSSIKKNLLKRRHIKK